MHSIRSLERRRDIGRLIAATASLRGARVRAAAVAALGRIGSPAVRPALAGLERAARLAQPSPLRPSLLIGPRRLRSIYLEQNLPLALAAMGDVAVKPLSHLLLDRDADPRERAGAARALGSSGLRHALRPLTDGLRATDGDVRRACASAIATLADANAAPDLTERLADPEAGLAAAMALKSLGHQGRASLRAARASGQPLARVYAAMALAQLEEPGSLSVLRECARSREVSVRSAAVYALAACGLQAADDIKPYLLDPEPEVRRWASFSLAEVQRPRRRRLP